MYVVKGKLKHQYPDNAYKIYCLHCNEWWHKKYQVELRPKMWLRNRAFNPPSKGHVPIRLSKTKANVIVSEVKAMKELKARARAMVNFKFAPIPEWRKQPQQDVNHKD